MTADGSDPKKRAAGEVHVGRAGELSVDMTAHDILSLAVNVAQNKWPLEESHSTAMRLMLDEICEQVLEANRLAVRGSFSDTRAPLTPPQPRRTIAAGTKESLYHAERKVLRDTPAMSQERRGISRLTLSGKWDRK